MPSTINPNRYGASCGYWTTDRKHRDNHVLAFHFGGNDDPEIHDLGPKDYAGEPLHQCGVMP